ncbi:hypothetical protein FOCG_17863 [Fusarium oxysporum f. sp. radicis-lycopersici 26381]|uniref:O-methyltransferase n=1 Tax=Fusarium oxysporum NRRL 32931 TaxID=660029 RepID=W9HCK9_FUSOX|nr:hypothetical protein FOYG_16889 [Fusarium oxysporum NRRL 32931]EWZ78484.1 hypothetical protein FOWG_17272 [Fusarium oxysporum f. sp. lycopersici MN25]EXL39532.1 hypothetical protein FOCG_17863 [Fusarium oxysporum f. sp. radicis-lycopersici 26381]
MADPHGTAARALEASPRIHKMLQHLHAISAAQEKSFSQIFFYLKMLVGYYIWNTGWSQASDDHMRDKFVSLEEDKCQFMYLLARSMGAKNIIEAGTSFGVSTIYLALAVGQNVADARATTGTSVTGKVIATEKEPTKIARARDYWKQAGNEVEPWIELREGDLRETLKVAEGMPEQVDMLLLDIWTPMALPVLEIVKPRLRKGAIVLADNTSMAKPLYKEFLAYIHDPRNGFKTMTTPFSGGLEMIVYRPSN